MPCSCNVKRWSLFNLIHIQRGEHRAGCPNETEIERWLRRLFGQPDIV